MPTFLVNCSSSNDDYDADCDTLVVDINVAYAQWLLSLKTMLETIATQDPRISGLTARDYGPTFFNRYRPDNNMAESQYVADLDEGEGYIRTEEMLSIPDRGSIRMDYVLASVAGVLPLRSYDGVKWEAGPHDADIIITSNEIPWHEITQIVEEATEPR